MLSDKQINNTMLQVDRILHATVHSQFPASLQHMTHMLHNNQCSPFPNSFFSTASPKANTVMKKEPQGEESHQKFPQRGPRRTLDKARRPDVQWRTCFVRDRLLDRGSSKKVCKTISLVVKGRGVIRGDLKVCRGKMVGKVII